MEAQIADLRASPGARRALESRVWHHLSKRSKRPNRQGRGQGKAPDDGSIGSSDSAESAAFYATAELGGERDIPHDGSGWQERSAGNTSIQGRDTRSANGGKGRSMTGKAAESPSVSERAAAQLLRTQEVQRRKR